LVQLYRSAARAPANDLNFIKCLKLYENEHAKISKAAITKICNHLWYLTEVTAALAFFDDTLSNEIKRLMVFQGLKLKRLMYKYVTARLHLIFMASKKKQTKNI